MIEGLTAAPLDASTARFIETGNPTPVAAVAWSPDEHKIAVVHADSCGSIFILETGQTIPFGRAASEPAEGAAAWHPSNAFLAVTGPADTPLLNGQGEVVLTIPEIGTALAFSEGNFVIASKRDFAVSLWSVAQRTCTQLARFDLHKAAIRAIAVSGGTIATAGTDKCVGFVAAAAIAAVPSVLRGHVGAVTAVTFAGALLVSGGTDGTLFLWRAGQLEGLIRAHSGAVSAIAVHPDEHTIASAGADGCAKIWELNGSNECIGAVGRHTTGTTVAAFHPRGELLATGGRDGILGLWQWRQSKMLTAFAAGSPIIGVDFDRQGRFVLVTVDGPVPAVVPVGEFA